MNGRFVFLCLIFCTHFNFVNAQLQWTNADEMYGPLPASMHVFKSNTVIEGQSNIAFYTIVDLKDKNLEITTDTTLKRRLTPAQFYQKNKQPLLVVNTTFFSFATNQNLNLVVKNGKLVGYNIHSVAAKGKDTLLYHHAFHGALGISKKAVADIAWVYSDSTKRLPYASQKPIAHWKDSSSNVSQSEILRRKNKKGKTSSSKIKKWKMKTAVGGGPVLVQNSEIKISNNEEMKFGGKAIDDKHPRTAIGYTADNKLVILVVQGRMPGIAEGASLTQLAQILKDLGCAEALNLDGGGSSCMLINGKETIQPSDKDGQRPVPAVFIIKSK